VNEIERVGLELAREEIVFDQADVPEAPAVRGDWPAASTTSPVNSPSALEGSLDWKRLLEIGSHAEYGGTRIPTSFIAQQPGAR